MSWRQVVVGMCLIIIPSCAAPIRVQDATDHCVSMVSILANPRVFNGKTVTTMGFLHLEFESNQLWLDRSQYLSGLDANSIAISVPSELESRTTQFSDKIVMLTGTFSAAPAGMARLSSGYIHDITILGTWGPDFDPRSLWRKDAPEAGLESDDPFDGK